MTVGGSSAGEKVQQVEALPVNPQDLSSVPGAPPHTHTPQKDKVNEYIIKKIKNKEICEVFHQINILYLIERCLVPSGLS